MQEPVLSPESRYRWVIAVLILAAHLCVGLNLFSVSPVLPVIIEEYGISRTAASLLVALALLVTAAFGLPGGVIAMRLGLKTAFALAWFFMGLQALSALAPGYPALLFLRLLFGLGAALVLTATGPLLVTRLRPREVLLMNGLNTAVLSSGIALSVGGMASLAESIGWEAALSAYGALGVAGTAAWLLAGQGAVEFSSTERISIRGAPSVLLRRPILLLLAADAGVLVQYTALSAWLPTFYSESRGMTLSQAGLATGILPFAGIFGVLLGGILPLVMRSPRLFLLVPGVMVILGGLGSFVMDDLTVTYAGLVLLGLGSWLYVPTLLSLSMDLVDRVPARIAIVWGSLITFSGFSMFVSPIFVGYLYDRYDSYLPGFILASVASWTLFASGLFISPSPLARNGLAKGENLL